MRMFLGVLLLVSLLPISGEASNDGLLQKYAKQAQFLTSKFHRMVNISRQPVGLMAAIFS